MLLKWHQQLSTASRLRHKRRAERGKKSNNVLFNSSPIFNFSVCILEVKTSNSWNCVANTSWKRTEEPSLSTQLTNLSFNFAAKSISNVFISNPKFQQVTPSCSHPQSSRPFQYLSKLAKQTGSTLELADVDERMGEFIFAISQSLHPPGVRKSRHLQAW